MAEGQLRSNGKFTKRDEGAIGSDSGASVEINAGDGANTVPVIDPQTVERDPASVASEPAKRGRGRPKKEAGFNGFKAKDSTEKRKTLDVEVLNKLLFSVHLGLSKLTKVPEIAIDESESKMLADATKQLMEVYDITYTEKQEAWFNFYTALTFVYGSRIAVFAFKKKQRGVVAAPESEVNHAGFETI